ncbi:quinone-dependent dihydroorotate dehydrogenase [Patescibacteria group bacterium]
MTKLKYEIFDSIYQVLVRPVLFLFDPEAVHDAHTNLGHEMGKYHLARGLTNTLLSFNSKHLEQNIIGIKFKNPIGLSAGFDKDANLMQILPEIGFGFTQVGSVTLHPYEGNPKPRLFRLPKSKGIVVYYGLKNIGVDKIIDKVKGVKVRSGFPVSISIAKTNSKTTATDKEAVDDYHQSLKKCIDQKVGNFYTINISCPNTYGGESFTTPERLDLLLAGIKKVKTNKPIFVKMPINLSWSQFDSLMKVVVKHKIHGVIIGNLNKNRKDKTIKDEIPKSMKGGISGIPTKELSNNLISKTYKKYGKKVVIVGVGGVFDAQDAYEKIKLGASLVQLITGMIYEGPQLIGKINYDLVQLLEKDGYKNISEAVGVDA